MDMEFEDAIDLVIKAREKAEEAKAWSIWLSLRPHMTEETFVPFSEFYVIQKSPYTKKLETKKSTEELLKEMNELSKQFI